MKVGVIYSPLYLEHDTGQHPENARRLQAIIGHIKGDGTWQKLVPIEPRPATTGELSLVHEERHILHIREVAEKGGGWLDPDTVMSPGSYTAALYAAGGVIRATEAVMAAEVDSAFALVRPPGHHATPGKAMGFCLFNNVAVSAKYALNNYELSRLLIIDFDVHHGNGTQAAFYDDPRVLYVSTHQSFFYPGTGGINEAGSGEARGTTVNIPLPAGCGDGEYQRVFEQLIIPAAGRFKPQLILVSAGYDAHWADELAMMQVSITGFAQIARFIRQMADGLCHGRLVFSLEGGYNLVALSASVKATLDVLLGSSDTEDPLGKPPGKTGTPDITPLIEQIKEIHRLP